MVNLLKKLQKEKGLTYLFIAHDLSMVKQISDRIGVMYLGHMMELTTSKELYRNPLHPYTRALLSAIPIPDLQGELPSPIDPPSGCVFRTRCPHSMDICAEKTPVWQEAEKSRFVACHLYDPNLTGNHDSSQAAASK
ncbi:oligopeptide/dipeptide ABC transporter, ATP-binding protein [Mycobacteroides abscessus subsp. abscessus]|nr:oligopeptide/dipeptide ABC transporter, ATP-binding protein [Mycobacteroides abscessus subsp. abscessus]